ncbi:LysR family transcriptional regulator [Streptomyces sp. JJ66]|uniref:LysR family transcriptional regulator n=1 Tax=Streptomyces sp. JJ66 TaxID=2803843 RepID=UPI001C563239|nr:LysR family transcriptional regulator [Streptomyces sp. JJ66]MBW1601444.1 LysR family transcriptional regulator [Streptomyces sp. JJ66]
MELELRHLRVVRAVAEAGSLTKAASALGVAQPALSAQLKRVERMLGGQLFERSRQGVRPTALGELVLHRTRVVLPAVAALQEEAVRFARGGGQARGFRLGGTHGPLLGGLVDRLASAHPGVPVTTQTSWSERVLAEAVRAGRLDFALAGACGDSAPPGVEGLVWRVVAVDPVFVMLPEDHVLAGRTEIALAELAGATWTDVPGDGCFADCFAAACARAGFTPAGVYETDTAACVHLVRVGRAVGLCRATFPPTPGLVTRPLAGTPLSWRHLIGWHPDAASACAGVPAPAVLGHARAAHADAAARSASYTAWLTHHPDGVRGVPAMPPPPAGPSPCTGLE